jgi:4-amino-4-deoxy-L-arabinose transferase-like glycosyltransferase
MWGLMLLPLIASAWARELWAPDEPRYAQVAREIYERGDFLVMHLCGRVYPDKPPLLFWLSGLCGWLSGWNEFWMRVPSLLATLGTAWLVARIARSWWGPRTAAWAPALYLGTAMVTDIGGRLQIDPLLAFLCTLALWMVGCSDHGRLGPAARVLVAGLCVGIGGLAKGPVALVNVGLVVIAWAWLAPSGTLPRVRPTVWLGALALSLAPSVLWAISASFAEPQLAGELFFGQHAGRVTQADRHPGPIWKHLLRMPLWLLPWTLVVAAGLVDGWRNLWRKVAGQPCDAGRIQAAAWLAALLLFYSIIPPKRDLYLLPAYPAAALLAASAVVTALDRRRLSRWIGFAGPVVLLAVGVGVSLAVLFTDRLGGLEWRGPLVGLPLVVGSALAIVFAGTGRIQQWGVAVLAGWGAFAVLLSAVVMPPINPLKSAKTLALELAARPERPSEVPCWGVRPEGYRFYSDGRLPTVASSDLEAALRRDVADFLALIHIDNWATVDPYLRTRMRVLQERRVGGKELVVVGTATAP